MRILNVNSLIDPLLGGGTAERTLQLSKALALAGHEVGILALKIGLEESISPLPERVSLYLLPSLNERFHVPTVSMSVLRTLVSSYDVIHMMGHWSVLNALVANVARKEGIPYVLCPAGSLQIFGRSKLLKCAYNSLVGKRLVKGASAWIAVTEDERSHFDNYGILPGNVIVISNGIAENDYTDQESNRGSYSKLTQGSPYILFMGRLNLIKGPDLLLEAFADLANSYQDVHLVFAGPDGGLLPSLRARAENLGLTNRIHFPGFVTGSQKIAAYSGARFLVIPSRSEAMSIVVLEAGACGIPVIITDQCGFNRVEAEGGGFVVSADSASIAEGMKRLLSDPNASATMGHRLRSFVLSSFTWTRVVESYVLVLEKIVKSEEYKY